MNASCTTSSGASHHCRANSVSAAACCSTSRANCSGLILEKTPLEGIHPAKNADKETRRQGDKETRRECTAPRESSTCFEFFLLVSLSPCLLVCVYFRSI